MSKIIGKIREDKALDNILLSHHEKSHTLLLISSESVTQKHSGQFGAQAMSA